MQLLEVSGAVRHIYIYIYIYVIRQLKVKSSYHFSCNPPLPLRRQMWVLSTTTRPLPQNIKHGRLESYRRPLLPNYTTYYTTFLLFSSSVLNHNEIAFKPLPAPLAHNKPSVP